MGTKSFLKTQKQPLKTSETPNFISYSGFNIFMQAENPQKQLRAENSSK
jgi:hypothetical protein